MLENLISKQVGMPVVTFECPTRYFMNLRCLVVCNYTWEEVFIQGQQEMLTIVQMSPCAASR